MTYREDDDSVVPEWSIRMGDRNGDYAALRNPNACEIEEFGGEEPPPSPRKHRPIWWWLKMALLIVFAVAIGVVFVVWAGPFLLNKEVIPILDWEMRTFSPQVLGLLLFASLVIFPSILLPSTPTMWVAGIAFGYGYGFLLILPGMCLGMSLPYFIGSMCYHRLHMWLAKWPKQAALIRLAGEGNWFHQFRAVVLLRVSPFPFVIFNYAAVATNVKYGPYIFGSAFGVIPEIFVTIYSGILIRNLADATQGFQSFTTPQIIYNVLGFLATLAATVAITIYAKRYLKKLQDEEVPLLQ
ncbi:hypothetical protein Sjap_020786 [Stephania japonica]|uniref:VTT domain-containing protein n=1 Tax=Stephania japonica TaxID=461633 RepID=A0AAP0F6W7_9MAGN